MSELKLSMITDEMTQNLEEAIAFAVEHGMQGVELRSVDDTTIGNIPNEKLHEYKKLLDEAGLQVVSLASPLCKCVLNTAPTAATVSTLFNGEYGIDDVCLSALALVDKTGCHGIIKNPLTEEEVGKLHASANKLKEIIANIEF